MTPYYDQDGITIYHGEALDVLRQLPDVTAAALLTDPPYSSGGMFRSDRQIDAGIKYRGWSHDGVAGPGTRPPSAECGSFAGDSRDQRGFAAWVGAWSFQALRVTQPSGVAFMFSDWRQLPTVTDALQLGGWIWRGVLVWDKGVGRPVRGRFRNHLEFIVWGSHGVLPDKDKGVYPSALISVPTVSPGDRVHVTQKPTGLLRSVLAIAPTGPVLDPFMGSGTTLRAAKDLGRKAIGIEVEERYCEIAAKRLSQGVLPFEAVA